MLVLESDFFYVLYCCRDESGTAEVDGIPTLVRIKVKQDARF